MTEEGAEFRSHLDGSRHLLTPERATDIQAQLGSDIAMVLDECIATPADEDAARAAMERSVRWAGRARAAAAAADERRRVDPEVIVTNPGQAQFGIVQGGVSPGAADRERAGDGRDRLRGVRDRRPERRRAAGGDLRHRRPHRAAAAGRPAAIPDGQRHAGRPDRMRGARGSISSTACCRRGTPATVSCSRGTGPICDQERPVCRGPAASRSRNAAATPAGTFRGRICATSI